MIDTKSLRRWKKQIKKLPAAAENHIQDAMKKNGDEGTKYMKLLAPVDSGKTQASIFYYVKHIPHGVRLTFGAGDGEEAPARIVEFVNDQAFFYPTIRIQGKRYRGRYRRAINKAAKEIATRG